MGVRVAVAGASGYAGGELLRLIAGHPELELAAVTADGSAGRPLAAVHPQLTGLPWADWPLAATGPAELAGADLVFLALPSGHSAALAAALPAGTRVVDLGADHRLTDPADWHRYYSGEPAEAWTYGLPELPGQRERIAAADRVAATGCYVAAVTLALRPLLDAGLASPDDVVVTAASGTSGAGRTGVGPASEVMGDAAAYAVGTHRHTPEIKQATGARSLTFTPVLAPMPRGILATVAALPAPGVTVGALRAALAAGYADEPFVHLLPPDAWPHTGATLGGNACHLQVTLAADSGRIVAVSALDNLGKGAAGQAVQCANLMLGLPETAGLSAAGVAP